MSKSQGLIFSTDREVSNLKPQDKRYSVKDKMNNGLFIEIKETGIKTWHYRYSFAGKQERLTLGRYPALSLKAARQLRDESATLLAKGISPHQNSQNKKQKKDKAILFREYGATYLHEVIHKDRSDPYAMTLYLNNDIYPFLGHMEMSHIGIEDIREVIWHKKQQGFDAAANQIRGLLKRMFDYAITLGLVPINPVLSIPAKHIYKAKARDRYLNTQEIKIFYQALLHSNLSQIKKSALLLSLLTLLRKSELLSAQWEHIDFAHRIWSIPKTKADSTTGQSREMLVYLSDQMVKILQELKQHAQNEPYVFCGRFQGTCLSHNTLNVAQKMVLATTDLNDFSIHDLRRTASTHLNEQGFNRDAIEKCLNHKTVGIRGVYNKAEYTEERKIMMQKWSDFVFDVIGDAPPLV